MYGEGNSENRVLAARHISPEKPLPQSNNAINSTVLCHTYTLQPDFGTYLAGKSILTLVSLIKNGKSRFLSRFLYLAQKLSKIRN